MIRLLLTTIAVALCCVASVLGAATVSPLGKKISDYTETLTLTDGWIYEIAVPGVTNYKVTFGTIVTNLSARIPNLILASPALSIQFNSNGLLRGNSGFLFTNGSISVNGIAISTNITDVGYDLITRSNLIVKNTINTVANLTGTELRYGAGFYGGGFASNTIWTAATFNAAFPPMDGMGLVSFSNKLWLLGGWSSSMSPTTTNSVMVSTNGIHWALATNAPWTRRHIMPTLVFNNKMWVFGGDYSSSGYQNDVWNTADGTNWVQVSASSGWSNRVLHTVQLFNGKLWLMGGQREPGFEPGGLEQFYKDVWVSSDGTNWSLVTTNAPWPSRGMMAGQSVHDGKMWLLGGGTIETPLQPTRLWFNDVWSTPDGTNWTQVLANAPWVPRSFHAVASWNGYLWVIQGHNGTNNNDVWYTRDGSTWTQLPNTPWNTRHAAGITIHSNAIWIAGGQLWNDVWKLHNDVATNGPSQFVVTGNRVGVNTEPLMNLDVLGGHVSGFGVARFKSTNGSFVVMESTGPLEWAGVRLISDEVNKWDIYNDASDVHKVKFRSPLTNVLTMTQEGWVGVSKTNPGVAMDVNGGIAAQTRFMLSGADVMSWHSNRLRLGGINAVFPFVDLYASNIVQATLTYDGKLGIGTTNPSSSLDVPGGVRAASAMFTNTLLLNNLLEFKTFSGGQVGWSNLVAGTLSLFLTDPTDDFWGIHGQLLVGDRVSANTLTVSNMPGAGSIVAIAANGQTFRTNVTGSSVAPPISSVQFNSNGVMQGSSTFTFTNGILTVPRMDVGIINASILALTNSGRIFVQTNTVSVTNTAVSTAMLSGQGTTNIAANLLAVGNTIRIRLWGIYYSSIQTPVKFKVLLGGSVIAENIASVYAPPASSAGGSWTLDCETVVRATGASGKLMTGGVLTFARWPGTTWDAQSLANFDVATFDTTSSLSVSLEADYDAASADAILCQGGTIEIIP